MEMTHVKITFILGGNCRIRSFTPLKGKQAEGTHPNPFFFMADAPAFVKKDQVEASEGLNLREAYIN